MASGTSTAKGFLTLVCCVAVILLAMVADSLLSGGDTSYDTLAPEVATERGGTRGPHEVVEMSGRAVYETMDGLIIVARYSDAEPVLGAFVVLSGPALGEPIVAEADSFGTARFPSFRDRVTVDIVRGSSHLHTEDVDGTGQHHLVIETECQIRGTASVDGVPAHPLRLAYRAAENTSVLHEPPESVKAALHLHRWYGRPSYWAQTDSEGRFLLPDAVEGTLHLQSDLYRFLDGSRQRDVTLDQSPLHLELIRPPTLSGRVLDAEADCVPGATVWYELACSTSQLRNMTSTDQEGLFAIPLDFCSAGPIQAKLDIRKVSVGAVTLDLGLIESQELGDIHLRGAATLEFRILGKDDTPVAGAYAWVIGAPYASDATDAKGLGSIDLLPQGRHEIRFEALGHDGLTKVYTLDRGRHYDEVVLPRATRLEVLLSPAQGEAKHLEVALSATTWSLFEEESRGTSDDPQVQLGASERSFEQRGVPHGRPFVKRSFRPKADRAVVSGLRPNVGFLIEVLDPSGYVVARAPGTPLEPSEWREVEIAIPTAGVVLSGRVVDMSNRPLHGALVRYQRERLTSARTDESGVFVLPPLHAVDGALLVSKQGHAPRAVPASVETLQQPIRLDEPRSAQVTLRGFDDTAFNADSVFARWRGMTLSSAQERSDGMYVLEDLPHEEVEVVVWLAGREFCRTLSTEQDATVFELPGHGSLLMTFAPPGQTATPVGLVLRALDEEAMDVVVACKGGDECLVTPLFPGRYAVELRETGEDPLPLTQVEVQVGVESVVQVPLPE